VTGELESVDLWTAVRRQMSAAAPKGAEKNESG
jgi:hypothetical protein